jgi:histone acetyltransferase MYST1
LSKEKNRMASSAESHPGAPSEAGATSAADAPADAADGEASPYTIEVGARMRAEWRDGELRDCEIIERRVTPDGVSQYYIHYTEFNRRLDEWVAAERLQKPEPTAKPASGDGKRRKLDPAVTLGQPSHHQLSQTDEATAGELDAATQKEHEAATKVKNINRIVLGKWGMQTWCARRHWCCLVLCMLVLTEEDAARSRHLPRRYFSPLPKEYEQCDTLYVCEYDLHFTKKPEALRRYMKRCELVRRRARTRSVFSTGRPFASPGSLRPP